MTKAEWAPHCLLSPTEVNMKIWSKFVRVMQNKVYGNKGRDRVRVNRGKGRVNRGKGRVGVSLW